MQPPVKRAASPAARGDLLVLRTSSDRLDAYSLSTGRWQWSRSWPRILSAPSITSTAVLINVFGADGYEIKALDPQSGADLWTVDDGSFSPPIEHNRRVYAAGRQALLVIEPRTGAIAGRLDAQDEIISSPAVVHDLLLFGTIDGVLHAAPVTASE
jgi:outer membrane protein assembly factor BamB